jgi:deazaflavin-dependent oxidoreductase (nitroreductase family)
MPPGRLAKRLLRLPTALYSMHAGWLLGHRFLLLVHRGRRSGRLYRTVLEVIAWREAEQEAIVMSGFGRSSQWYRNVLMSDPVEVRIGRLRRSARARELEADEATRVLAGYERRNRFLAPLLRVVFSRVGGFRYDGSEAARRRLVDALPLVAFRLVDPSAPDDGRGFTSPPSSRA